MSCGLPLPGRGLAAGAFSAAAVVLGVGSKVADQAATLLRGDGDGGAPAPSEPPPWDEPDTSREAWGTGSDTDDTPWPDRVGVVVDDLADTGAEVIDDLVTAESEASDAADTTHLEAEPALPVEPVPAADVTRVREPDTHAAELAARPAADVIAAVDRLSTDELSALYDEESRGKRRKTVLTAIEAALTP